ncbi:LegC family aminotransferase [Thiomicrorhabdus sediminis]|uniref:LegC family aminotransferase n=1 Tax=Thiomicrorhabdus sediminis TaxID=2580412 RepID=A0A4P9K7P3_9GAMM|nr:LegC family aminotransferase [Thiomicrorhabdus sediminis]QCU90480.1 LegC family aminotransferase [Thiomicrorhabdus sediminis]
MSNSAEQFKQQAQSLAGFIRQHYQVENSEEFIPLHAPCFDSQEKRLLNDCIDSTFVSSVGRYVDEFEQQVAEFTGAKHAVAVVNGTMGLFLALRVVGVEEHDLVITQSLTFVATANAIKMLGASPLFLDVDQSSLGLSAKELETFLAKETEVKQGQCFHKASGKRISACVPMHTLGFSSEIEEIVLLCHQYHIKVVEDAAESLGSYYQSKHTGRFGDLGVFSFNGNKVITTGGGGMLITNNSELAKQAKHLSTTAKVAHAWLFEHDQIGYNLRMPNINAALGVAQMQKLPAFLEQKKQLAEKYKAFIGTLDAFSWVEPLGASEANHWLNAILCPAEQRDQLLALLNDQGIQARPLWTPLHQQDIYRDELCYGMKNTEWLAARLVNIPSGVVCNA